MYNKKSRLSAILSMVAPALVFGLLVLCPILLVNTGVEGLGGAIALIFSIAVGSLPLYIGGIAFVAVSFSLGGKMFREQSRKKLIKSNVGMIIASSVLMIFLAIGIIINVPLISESQLGVFPIIYVVIMCLAYLAAWVNYIVTIVALKKMPPEEEAVAQEVEIPTENQQQQ